MSENNPQDHKRDSDKESPSSAEIVRQEKDAVPYQGQDDTRGQTERFTKAWEQSAKATQKVAEAAVKSADAAVASAKANRQMVYVSALLLLVTGVQCTYTNKSITQAERAITATIEASKLDQRAWVGMKGMDVFDFDEGKSVRAEVVISNSGKSFAKRLSGVVHLATTRRAYATGEELIKDARALGASDGSGASVLPPNGELKFTLKIEAPLTKEIHDPISNGVGKIYVIGNIEYDDIFGIRHYTRFFASYNTKTKGMQAEKTYNDAN